MTNVAEHIRGLLCSRLLRASVVAAWFTLVLLLAVESLADGENVTGQLWEGGYEGFVDRALQTDWVIAGITSVALAPALAAALSRTLTEESERELMERKEALTQCRQELQPMVERFESEKRRLEGASRGLRRAGTAIWVYNYTQTCAEGLSALSAICFVGAVLKPAGTALARFGSRLAQLGKVEAMAARAPARAAGRYAVKAAKVRLADAAVALAKAGGLQVSKLTAAGLVLREGAGFALGSNLRYFQDLRKRLHIGQGQAFEDQFRQLAEELKRQALELGKFGEQVHEHKKWCDDLAARLERISSGHQGTLRATRDAVHEAWRRAREAEQQPPPDPTLPPEGG